MHHHVDLRRTGDLKVYGADPLQVQGFMRNSDRLSRGACLGFKFAVPLCSILSSSAPKTRRCMVVRHIRGRLSSTN